MVGGTMSGEMFQKFFVRLSNDVIFCNGVVMIKIGKPTRTFAIDANKEIIEGEWTVLGIQEQGIRLLTIAFKFQDTVARE